MLNDIERICPKCEEFGIKSKTEYVWCNRIARGYGRVIVDEDEDLKNNVTYTFECENKHTFIVNSEKIIVKENNNV